MLYTMFVQLWRMLHLCPHKFRGNHIPLLCIDVLGPGTPTPLGMPKLHKKGKNIAHVHANSLHFSANRETSKLIGCSLHIQQPAATNISRKSYA